MRCGLVLGAEVMIMRGRYTASAPGTTQVHYEPQVCERDGKFYLSITTSHIGDQWTSPEVELRAATREEAVAEAGTLTRRLAMVLAGRGDELERAQDGLREGTGPADA